MADGALARGDRVSLRRFTSRDREPFLGAVLASRRLHGAWIAPPTDAQAFAEHLARARRPDVESSLLYRNADGAFAGVFNLSQIFYGAFRSAYLGYYALEPLAGHGYMHDGIRLLLRYAFDTMGLHRIEANVQPGNVASVALVRGAGFRLEGYSPRYLKVAGRWRDHERWAILAEDLPRRRPGGRRS